MTADGQTVLEEEVRVALGLRYVARASQRLGWWEGSRQYYCLLKKKITVVVHLKYPTAVTNLGFFGRGLHVREQC